jgi:hypothetical protein
LRDRSETMASQNRGDFEKTGCEEEERPFGRLLPNKDVSAANVHPLGIGEQRFPVRLTPAGDDQ